MNDTQTETHKTEKSTVIMIMSMHARYTQFVNVEDTMAISHPCMPMHVEVHNLRNNSQVDRCRARRRYRRPTGPGQAGQTPQRLDLSK